MLIGWNQIDPAVTSSRITVPTSWVFVSFTCLFIWLLYAPCPYDLTLHNSCSFVEDDHNTITELHKIPLHKQFLDLLLRVSVTCRHTVLIHYTTVSAPEIQSKMMTKIQFSISTCWWVAGPSPCVHSWRRSAGRSGRCRPACPPAGGPWLAAARPCPSGWRYRHSWWTHVSCQQISAAVSASVCQ